MRKAPLISFCTVAAMLLMCGVQSDNPLDPANPNFVPPKILIDSAETTIKNGDTIHIDSIFVSYRGNNVDASQFRVWLDGSMSQEWTKTPGTFSKGGILDGKHVFHIQTQYEGGDRTVEDSIVFFVNVTGYRPHFTQKIDTNITCPINSTFAISVNLAALVPVSYQWHKDTAALIGQQNSSLGFSNAQLSNGGIYCCVASNAYGRDTSRNFIIHISDNRDTAKSFSGFSFPASKNPVLTKDAIAQINGNVINATVPHNTNRQPLIAHFQVTGGTVTIGGIVQKSDTTRNDFSDTVFYLIAAGNGTTRKYAVIVALGTVDSTSPTVALLDPTIEGSWISANAKKIETIIKDSGGIARVRYHIGQDTFPVTKSNDSIFSATVQNLKPNIASTVEVVAWDSAGNSDSLAVHLTYNPTMNDNQPPIFSWISGPKDNQRVTIDTGTIRYKIADQSGIDSVYYSLNGINKGSPAVQADSQYEIHYILPKFGLNTIVINAVDKSTAHNNGRETITLNYNTKPGPFSVISPSDGDTGVENSDGVLFKWTKVIDSDGDTANYRLRYGTDTNVLASVVTKGDSMRLKNLRGGTTYFWCLVAIVGLDTVNCSSTNAFLRFSTRNHPATILQGLRDTSVALNDSLRVTEVAQDPEGIKEYRWDFNNDGTIDRVSAIGTTTFLPPAKPGVYPYAVFIVDSLGGITKDSAKVTVSKPTLNIVLTSAGNGTVIPTGTQAVTYGTDLPITATPASGYGFSEWTVTGNLAIANLKDSSTKILNVQGEGTVSAHFVRVFKVTIQSEKRGSTVPSGDIYVKENQYLDIKASCAGGFEFVKWSKVSGSSAIGDSMQSTTQIGPVTSSAIWKARFKAKGMKLIPAGSYIEKYNLSTFTYAVKISKSFWMDSTEVTKGQWSTIMGGTTENPMYPASVMTWYQAVLYCNALSKMKSLDTVY